MNHRFLLPEAMHEAWRLQDLCWVRSMTDCQLGEKQFVNEEVGMKTRPATGTLRTIPGRSEYGH